MIPMNPMQILQAVRNGANPNQIAMQLARSKHSLGAQAGGITGFT